MKYLNLLGLALLAFSVIASTDMQDRPRSDVVAQVALVEVDIVGNVQVNGQALPMADLSVSLTQMSLKAPMYVLMEISPDLPMGKHTGLMRELKSSNISGISWASSIDGKGLDFFSLTD